MTGPNLIIQIPCFNEAANLGITLASLPRAVPGFAQVEWMIIDDGSTDQTIAVAKAAGVDHIVRLGHNQGLARAFAAGIEAALRAGADVIVNTDADNQYRAEDIPKLTAPILAGEADLVIGARPIVDTPHFSRTKKALQLVGSMVVRMASRTQVVDAPSGFRALSRAAAERLHVHGEYTYTLETIIAAGQSKMAVTSVPIRTNPDLRPSRLVKSVPGYVLRSAITILRSFATYRPLRFFCGIGVLLFAGGCALAVRYLYFVALGEGDGHVQSVIVSALLIGMGVFTGLIGVVADLIAVNRELLEKLLARERSHGQAAPPAPVRPHGRGRGGVRRRSSWDPTQWPPRCPPTRRSPAATITQSIPCATRWRAGWSTAFSPHLRNSRSAAARGRCTRSAAARASSAPCSPSAALRCAAVISARPRSRSRAAAPPIWACP